ncbi:MAG: GYF domain-containing protein, partial [Gemmataceae bacterium]
MAWMTCPKCYVFFSYDETQGPAKCPSCDKAPAATTDAGWHYIRNQQKHGPISRAELDRLAAAGELSRQDMVMPAGASKWMPAAEVDNLFPTEAVPVAVAMPVDDGGATPLAEALPAAIPIITYFYAQQGLKIGPVSDDQLKELAEMGRLKPDDMVLQQGTTKWSPARSYDWLTFGKKKHKPAETPSAPTAVPVTPIAAVPVALPKVESDEDIPVIVEVPDDEIPVIVEEPMAPAAEVPPAVPVAEVPKPLPVEPPKPEVPKPAPVAEAAKPAPEPPKVVAAPEPPKPAPVAEAPKPAPAPEPPKPAPVAEAPKPAPAPEPPKPGPVAEAPKPAPAPEPPKP